MLTWVLHLFAQGEGLETALLSPMVRLMAGLGVGGVMAGVMFWLLIYLLGRQGKNYRTQLLTEAENYKEQLRIVRKERLQDINRMQEQIDRLYLWLQQTGTPPPPPSFGGTEEQDKNEE